MSDEPTPHTKAMQGALAGEHAALYAYEVAGGRLEAGSRAQARAAAAYRHHRERRDALARRLRSEGATPVVAEPAYALPVEVTNEEHASLLAVRVEGRCATLYAQVVASASGGDRSVALEAMTWCATQQLAWGGPSSALPGVGHG